MNTLKYNESRSEARDYLLHEMFIFLFKCEFVNILFYKYLNCKRLF